MRWKSPEPLATEDDPYSKLNGPVGAPSLEYYFSTMGFADLLPPAREIARELQFGNKEMIEAVCKVADKYRVYPPQYNRTAWFARVYREKLLEARAEILGYRESQRYRKT